MNTLDIGKLSDIHSDKIVIARSRKVAAFIALFFPALFVYLFIANIIYPKPSIESIFGHPILLIYLVPGTVAFIVWCRLYVYAAVLAFRIERPIFLDKGTLDILGRKFVLGEKMILLFDNSSIRLQDNGGRLATVPAYFIRLINTNPEINELVELDSGL